MSVMTAIAWIGIMFLIAMILRAKIPFLGNNLVPACLIGGVIGVILVNTVGLEGTSSADYTLISAQLYTFMFINLGFTVPEKTEKRKEKIRSLKEFRARMGDSMMSGIVGMGSYWAIAYAFQALIGFGILVLIGQIWKMPPVYGMLIPFGFAQGPGQAVTYGTLIEKAGWPEAIQVAILFSAVGFLVAYFFGVPFAKFGIRKGIASSKVKLSKELIRGINDPDHQESYGKLTTYSGNLDVLTFHVALIGIGWILGLQIGKLWAFVPGYFGELFSKLLFFNGMLAAYAVRFLMGKLGLLIYLDRGTQVRITNASTDFMVVAAFMAINMQIVSKWIVPVLIICAVVAVVTWFTLSYFAPRFGGRNDFERLLGEWGTVTGTNATGLSLVRIVDPENQTTTAAELGPANIVNVPASYVVAPAIVAFAANEMSTGHMLIALGGTIVAYLIFMKVVGVWGPKTFDVKKGEKYKDGKVIMRDGKSVSE